MWLLWRRVRSLGPCVTDLRTWPLPWGRGWFRGPRGAAVEAWPGLLALCGRRGSVADPLGPVWPPMVLVRSLGSRVATLGYGRSTELRVATQGAWPIPWAPCWRRGGGSRLLGTLCLP